MVIMVVMIHLICLIGTHVSCVAPYYLLPPTQVSTTPKKTNENSAGDHPKGPANEEAASPKARIRGDRCHRAWPGQASGGLASWVGTPMIRGLTSPWIPGKGMTVNNCSLKQISWLVQYIHQIWGLRSVFNLEIALFFPTVGAAAVGTQSHDDQILDEYLRTSRNEDQTSYMLFLESLQQSQRKMQGETRDTTVTTRTTRTTTTTTTISINPATCLPLIFIPKWLFFNEGGLDPLKTGNWPSIRKGIRLAKHMGLAFNCPNFGYLSKKKTSKTTGWNWRKLIQWWLVGGFNPSQKY